MSEFKKMNTVKLENVYSLCDHYDSQPLTLNSSALKVVTDFTRRAPQMILKDVDIDHALFMMVNGHVRSKLVIDHDDTFLGVVNSRDLTGRKVLSTAQKRNQARSDLTVEDVMTSKNDLHALPYSVIREAKIGDVLETLKEIGQQHVLLVSKNGGLRGMISASDIARALHIPVNIIQKAHSFKEIFAIIHGHEEMLA
ncbi:CBS domain-containing protein [Pseudoalteromonas sp. S16_S37]|uniref:CBS domain-containing protein n=1 Tax=Pseudoalteromonas sp. S16_S37 TaxID=2720228 RepID=UPI0016810F63|nr:CBS domain-containing protein [Pseudoalteromonas sp. S16_S37]MBD1582478.1 CBS domain-containing protein [Pseudoalteromonas sp. S16_S37]